MIEIRNLVKKYGKLKAVDGLNLKINDGGIYALLGLKGAGKSTTVKIISGLIQKTSGSVVVNGINIDESPDKIKKIVSFSPQETAVANNLTVRENLELIATLYNAKNLNEAVNNHLKKFGLTEKETVRAKKLSGGQKRRLSIAMSVIADPKILILDEPTLGLDVLARRNLWEIIKELKKSVTVILTTHYLEEAEALADKIGILKRGRLVTEGSPEEITSFSGAKNFEEAFIALAKDVEGDYDD
ncbi:MAG: ABC transporter ATP-binding protein [Clostridia bacterium]|nr:ABC transporter ATP-binding protein [Clostridia bacterium]